jgi:hypothetical protein
LLTKTNNSHIGVYGNPGWGYNVFWRRLLLVIIGFAGAIVVQLFPAPLSATKHTAKGLATTLRGISNLYATITAKWLTISPDAPAIKLSFPGIDDQSKPADAILDSPAQRIALAILEGLVAVGPSIQSVAFEPSSSPFTAGSLTKIHGNMMQITESLAQLIGSFEALPPPYRARFRSQTAALNEALISDVLAVLHLVEGALRTGQPLPEIMPTPLFAKSIGLSSMKGPESLNRQLVEDPSWPAYTVLSTGFATLLARIDHLVLHVKEAVGETDMIGAVAEQGGWGFGELSVTKMTAPEGTEKVKE